MMAQENLSQSSLDSISIKLTESHLPSANYIRTSQQMISLTYTASIENMSDERLHIPDFKEYDNMMSSIQSKRDFLGYESRYRRVFSKQEDNDVFTDKIVFKKKSLLKVSNMEFSTPSSQDKNRESPAFTKGKKIPIKLNTSATVRKTKSPKNDSLIQSRIHSRSKDTTTQESIDSSGENFFMRTARFYSLKNDRVVEPKKTTKISIRKEVQKKLAPFETERKFNRLPIIKGTNFHSSAPFSIAQRRKILTCHENAQTNEKQMGSFTDKIILGKSCKMIQNDEKAKKYLQKIIQNRSSIMHYSQNQSNKLLRDFKQNIDEFY